MDLSNLKFEKVSKVGKIDFKSKNLKNISKLDSVSPPSVFVGSGLKYPLMNVGILSPVFREENAWMYDAPKYWVQEKFSISDVLKLREGLVNSRVTQKAKDVRFSNNFLNIARDIAIASKPVDVEIKLRSNLSFNPNRDRVLMPSLLGAPLESAKITSNVSVNSCVEKVLSDELKAKDSLELLYRKNVDENALSKILSIGVLGLQKNKKLVPTRWSITATDDTISNSLLSEIKRLKEIEDFSLGFGEFLGNQYLILFFPGIFRFELFEFYYPGSSWNPSTEFKACTDYENFSGRKNYASQCAGGYYATRLGVAEYLKKINRQASVLVIRLETPSYWAGLGVWVVRESVRTSLDKGIMKFSRKEELLNSVIKVSQIKYGFNPEVIYRRSKLLMELENQNNLSRWI